MTNPGCPSDEDLAAFIDGREGRNRASLLEHLNGCESCFEVFARTAEFRDEHTGSTEAPDEPRRASIAPLAAAAAVVLGLGTVVWLWLSATTTPQSPDGSLVASLLPLLRSESLAEPLSDELWRVGSNRFRFEGAAGVREASFESGVLMTGIAVNLNEGRIEEAMANVAAIHAIVPGIEVAPLLSAIEDGQDGLATVRWLEDAIVQEVDLLYFSLGSWAEAGRLAARARGTDLLSSPAFRAETRRLLECDFRPEVRRELRAIGSLTLDSEPSLEDPNDLEEAFTQILLVSSRK